MLGIYLATVAIVVACVLVGAAAWRLCGWARASWLAGAVGLAVLLAISATFVRLPHGATAAAAADGALVLGSLIVLARSGRFVAGGPGDVVRLGLPTGVLVLALVSLPFAVSGRAGILGVGDNNDMTSHLTAAWWLITHQGPAPDLVRLGYPLGPHALVAAVAHALGVTVEHAFTGLLLAIPILTALAALHALGDRARGVWRILAAALIGVVYLDSSYLALSSFKETAMGLFLLAFALSVAALARAHGRRARRAVVLGLLVAGTVHLYGYFGVIWPLAAIAGWAGLEVVHRRPRGALRGARAAIAPAAAAVLTAAVLVGPIVDRLWTFSQSTFANEPVAGTGNLVGRIAPLEGVGAWWSSDFRLQPAHPLVSYAISAVALMLLLAGLAWWMRRRVANDGLGALAVPGALIVSAAIFAYTVQGRSPYQSAKALVVLAPLAMLVMTRPVLAGWRPWRSAPAGPGLRARLAGGWSLPARAVAVVVLGCCAWASFIVLRDAPVGPLDHHQELASLRPVLGQESTLFLGNDDMVGWYLHGVRLARPEGLLYPVWSAPVRPAKPLRPGRAIDMDSMTAATLDQFRYVILPRSPYESRPAPNWQRVRSTRSFTLWRTLSLTAPHAILREGGQPGVRLSCATPAGRALSRRTGVAEVRAAPVQGSYLDWSPVATDAGQVSRQTVVLPPGTWVLSLQYVSRTGVEVRLPGGSDVALPPTAHRLGPYVRAGTVHVARRGPVTVTARLRPMSWLGRLLGARGHNRILDSYEHRPLGAIAFTRADQREHLVPLRRACGRYVDWYRLTPRR